MLPMLKLAFLCSFCAAHLVSNLPPAGLLLSQTEALKAAFPAGAERKTHFLSKEEVARAKLAGAMHVVYTGGSAESDTAFFERCGPVTVMVLVRPDGAVRSVTLLASQLPKKFLPPAEWLSALEGRRLDDLSFSSRGLPRGHEALDAAQGAFEAARRSLAVFATLKR